MIAKMSDKPPIFIGLADHQGVRRLAHYHLYYLRQGMLVGSGHIDAADDAEAVRRAREQSGSHIVEVWSDERRIRVLGPAQETGR